MHGGADARKVLGRKGEKLAERFLRRKGHRVRARNYSCAYGEIDLITQHKDTIVFVEVRSLSTDQYGLPWDVLKREKKERILRAARNYLYKYRLSKKPFRFDFIQMIIGKDDPPRIEHIENAF